MAYRVLPLISKISSAIIKQARTRCNVSHTLNLRLQQSRACVSLPWLDTPRRSKRVATLRKRDKPRRLRCCPEVRLLSSFLKLAVRLPMMSSQEEIEETRGKMHPYLYSSHTRQLTVRTRAQSKWRTSECLPSLTDTQARSASPLSL